MQPYTRAMLPGRFLLALAIAMTLVFASVAPVEATKGGSSSGGSKSSSKSKSSDGEEEEAGEEAEGEESEGGCGSGTWIAFPLLGGIVLVRRRRARLPS